MQKLFFGLILLASFSTSLFADDQKPSAVKGVSVTNIADSAVRVTWNKPWDNVGVLGYNVYRNGVYFATVFDTNFIDKSVKSGSEYRYGIVAFDKAKNFNSVSNEVSITTGQSNNNSGNNNDSAPPPPAPVQSNGDVNTPDGLWAEIQNGNTAKIKWRAPSGDLKGYNVYRDGSYITTVSSPEYTDSSLRWDNDHRFQIVAISKAIRFSNKSDTLIVNTAKGASEQPEQQNNESPQNDEPQSNDSNNEQPDNNGSAPDGYRLVFSDEFNGRSIDRSKWNSTHRWGSDITINGERQYYVDRINNPDFGHSPFEFDGNHITISAIETPEHLKSSSKWKPYLSGVLTTYNKFKMKYGYVEMRAQLPKGRGLWSAFWLLHQKDNDRRPEIDVVEYIGHEQDLVYNTYHWYENNRLRSSPSHKAWGPDYSQGMHTYAVKWEPGKVTWYVDGEERNSFQNGNVAWEDMYLIVNLAVGGWWPGNPNGDTKFPARFKIDYIRAYQKN